MIKKVKSYVIACQKHQKLQRSAAPTKPNEHGGLKQGKELKECDKNKLASRRKKKKIRFKTKTHCRCTPNSMQLYKAFIQDRLLISFENQGFRRSTTKMKAVQHTGFVS